VGPESAGAQPGPVCYGRGGTVPTVTDADLLLGYINPAGLLGGRVPLDIVAAQSALKQYIADPLGISPEEAAAAIYEVINVNMATAVKDLLHERGDDPREFALVVAGGAGPLHAVPAAAELGISFVIIPRDASIFTAAGVIFSDLRHDFVQTYFATFDQIDCERLGAIFAALAERGRAALNAEAIASVNQSLEYSLDLRYERQIYEIPVPIPAVDKSIINLESAAAAFHQMHAEAYGYNLPNARIELINARLTATGRTRPFYFPEQETRDPPAAMATRAVFLPGTTRRQDIEIYNSDLLGRGAQLTGPALVEGQTTSVLVPAGWVLEVDRFGSYLVSRTTQPG
jgi:N-methylhydantoinase A